MLLDDVLVGLRDVRDGKVSMTPEQADTVLDAIYLLMERQKVTEEKLAYYKRLEAEGRLKVMCPMDGERCVTCQNYDQIPETLRGYCKVKFDRYRKKKPLLVSRSRKACKHYRKKE